MADIINIGTIPNNMLATVENLADWIKDGNISCFCLCAVTKDGGILSALIAETDKFSLLGAVTDMQRTITDTIERR
jgi:hypothetical protein